MVRRTPRVVNPKYPPLSWARHSPAVPPIGGGILHRSIVALIVVASTFGTGSLHAQAVVLPGATYIEAPGGPAPATAARWDVPGGTIRVLRVGFAPAPGGQDDFWNEARDALVKWSVLAGVPFEFVVAESAEELDVEFRWVERFRTSQAGATHRLLDEGGHMQRATVVLARAHTDGTPMGAEFRRLVALHEVGHVLGLPHSEDPGDVMHPGNRNLAISARDLRSLRSLYGSPE